MQSSEIKQGMVVYTRKLIAERSYLQKYVIHAAIDAREPYQKGTVLWANPFDKTLWIVRHDSDEHSIKLAVYKAAELASSPHSDALMEFLGGNAEDYEIGIDEVQRTDSGV